MKLKRNRRIIEAVDGLTSLANPLQIPLQLSVHLLFLPQLQKCSPTFHFFSLFCKLSISNSVSHMYIFVFYAYNQKFFGLNFESSISFIRSVSTLLLYTSNYRHFYREFDRISLIKYLMQKIK